MKCHRFDSLGVTILERHSHNAGVANGQIGFRVVRNKPRSKLKTK